MNKKYKFSTLLGSILILMFFAASCSLRNHIPSLQKLSSLVPSALKPAATPSRTLAPGAPDITQEVVTEISQTAATVTPTAAVPGTSTVAVTESPQALVTGSPQAVVTAISKGVSQAPKPEDVVVYGDALAADWGNWSWDTTTVMDSAKPVYAGKAAISAEIQKPWAALYLHADHPLPASKFTAVRFWINGGTSGGQSIAFKVIDAYNKNWENLVAISLKAGAWIEVTVPLERLGSPEDIGALIWQDNAGKAEPTFFVDGVTLVAYSGPPLPTAAPLAGPGLTIDVQANRNPISPYIYGMNFADADLATELHLPVRRWGGNATTLYNWKIDVHNTGNDWFFENIPDNNPHPENLPNGSSVDLTVDQDRSAGSKSIITIPLIGWTPKRLVASHPYDCSYKVSKYGKQQNVDQWDPDCGNGKDINGNNLTGNDPNDAFMPVTTDFIKEWLTHLTGKYQTAKDGGVMFYSLDNEPMLWPYNHRDVHPKMTTYDELRDQTYTFAPIIKSVDPSAQTLGPVEWGWCGWLYSALDECKPGPDYSRHNQTFFSEWYLQQMAAYEKEHGIRILDYLDLHIYPQAQGVFSDDPGDLNTQAVRLRSTRSLWDQTYIDESWIGKAVNMIPRMHAWVEKNYPGTKLAITEYSWGARGSLNGALAQADILGIFGREGLDLAALWSPPSAKQPAAYAFRMYLNYDGKGSTFGDTSISAVSSDQDKLAVYAAQRSTDGALTLMIINKTRTGLISTVTVKNATSASSVKVYQYSGDDLTKISQLSDLAFTSGGFTRTFPANSITLLIVPQK